MPLLKPTDPPSYRGRVVLEGGREACRSLPTHAYILTRAAGLTTLTRCVILRSFHVSYLGTVPPPDRRCRPGT